MTCPRSSPFRFLAILVLGLIASGAWAADKLFDEPPTPMKTVSPVHPEQLKRDGVSGMVAVGITVDEAGFVQDATVKKSTHPDFEKPALDAVSKWKFKPAMKDGKPVAVKVVVPVKFAVD